MIRYLWTCVPSNTKIGEVVVWVKRLISVGPWRWLKDQCTLSSIRLQGTRLVYTFSFFFNVSLSIYKGLNSPCERCNVCMYCLWEKADIVNYHFSLSLQKTHREVKYVESKIRKGSKTSTNHESSGSGSKWVSLSGHHMFGNQASIYVYVSAVIVLVSVCSVSFSLR